MLVPPILLVIKDGPASAARDDGTTVARDQSGFSASEAMRTRAFVLIVIGLFLATFTYQSVLTQIVPHLEDIGIDRARAAIALSFISLAGMGGKVFFGWLTDIFPVRYAVGVSLGCQVIGLLILITVGTSSPLLWVFVPIFGVGFGGLGSLMPLVVQNTFGLKAFGSIFGMLNFFILGAALLGPPLVGLSFDTWGSYSPAFLTLSVFFVVGAIVMAFAVPPQRKSETKELGQLERAAQ
jgi:MFS family permease